MQARRIRESTRTARLASTHYPKLELPDVATEAYICGEGTLKILLLSCYSGAEGVRARRLEGPT